MKDHTGMKPDMGDTCKADMETLLAAHEIKNDKARMKAVKKHAKQKMASIESIADLKTYYDAKYGSGKKMAKDGTKAHEGMESPMMEKSEGKDDKEKE